MNIGSLTDLHGEHFGMKNKNILYKLCISFACVVAVFFTFLCMCHFFFGDIFCVLGIWLFVGLCCCCFSLFWGLFVFVCFFILLFITSWIEINIACILEKRFLLLFTSLIRAYIAYINWHIKVLSWRLLIIKYYATIYSTATVSKQSSSV